MEGFVLETLDLREVVGESDEEMSGQLQKDDQSAEDMMMQMLAVGLAVRRMGDY